jgi:predicted DNA-binding WGR domain protein
MLLSRSRSRWVEARSVMIALEARAPTLNRLRSWTLTVDQDRFGQWQAIVTFGRIGRHAQACRHVFEEEAGLSRVVRRALLRRRSATRTIGVSCEAVEASPSVLPILAQLGLAVSG